MSEKQKYIEELDNVSKTLTNLYHKYATAIGLSDLAQVVLYAIVSFEPPCTQRDICERWGYSKQSVNTAVNSLVQLGFITLADIEGDAKRKQLVLTCEGEEFVGSAYYAPHASGDSCH